MATVWTEHDIHIYRTVNPCSYEPLNDLYQRRQLPDTNPEERAQFLAEEILHCTQTDHELLIRTAAKEGRATALKLLEHMVIAAHQQGTLQFPK